MYHGQWWNSCAGSPLQVPYCTSYCSLELCPGVLTVEEWERERGWWEGELCHAERIMESLLQDPWICCFLFIVCIALLFPHRKILTRILKHSNLHMAGTTVQPVIVFTDSLVDSPRPTREVLMDRLSNWLTDNRMSPSTLTADVCCASGGSSPSTVNWTLTGKTGKSL